MIDVLPTGGSFRWRTAQEIDGRFFAGVLAGKSAEHRPREELCDLEGDPWEQKNLVTDPRHAERLGHMRTELGRWMTGQGDKRTVFGELALLESRGSEQGK